MTFEPSGFVSGLAGILLGGAVVRLWLRNVLAEMRDLRKEIEDIKTERIAGLEKRLERMETNCVGAVVSEQYKGLKGLMSKIDLKLDRFAEETSEQRADIKHDHDYISDVATESRAHAADRSLHSG